MSTEIHKRYFEGKSYGELHEIRRHSVPGSDVYQQAVEEIHRIQQDTNNTQIANLIGEIKNLKEITESNARSSSIVSSMALVVAFIGLVIAFLSYSTQADEHVLETTSNISTVCGVAYDSTFELKTNEDPYPKKYPFFLQLDTTCTITNLSTRPITLSYIHSYTRYHTDPIEGLFVLTESKVLRIGYMFDEVTKKAQMFDFKGIAINTANINEGDQKDLIFKGEFGVTTATAEVIQTECKLLKRNTIQELQNCLKENEIDLNNEWYRGHGSIGYGLIFSEGTKYEQKIGLGDFKPENDLISKGKFGY